MVDVCVRECVGEFAYMVGGVSECCMCIAVVCAGMHTCGVRRFRCCLLLLVACILFYVE